MSWTRRDTQSNPPDDIILVDEHDRPLGTGQKNQVHQAGLLHRAFSIFIVNSQGEWLLQQRAADKYHSSELWSNACCSHPRPGESVQEAAGRRLTEELGVRVELEHLGHLVYRTNFEDGLEEHEFDHLFWAVYDGPFAPDPAEVADLRWIAPQQLREELKSAPEKFTFWFREVMAGQATGPGVEKLEMSGYPSGESAQSGLLP